MVQGLGFSARLQFTYLSIVPVQQLRAERWDVEPDKNEAKGGFCFEGTALRRAAARAARTKMGQKSGPGPGALL